MKRAFSFVGYSGSGKTTLIERLIAAEISRGKSVAAIKHTHHDLDPLTAGDAEKFVEAGAAEVILAGKGEATFIKRMHRTVADRDHFPFTSPIELLGKLSAATVFIEGFKHFTGWPRLLIDREGLALPELSGLVAVVSDRDCALGVPLFARDDIDGLLRFLDRIAGEERV